MVPLLTPDEVAELLGVKTSTIYQWSHQDYIPHVKLGRLLRFNMSAIEKWIEKKATSGRLTHRVDIKELGL